MSTGETSQMSPTVAVAKGGSGEQHDVLFAKASVTTRLGGAMLPGERMPSLPVGSASLQAVAGPTRTSREDGPGMEGPWWPLGATDRVAIRDRFSSTLLDGEPTSAAYGGDVELSYQAAWMRRSVNISMQVGNSNRTMGAPYAWRPSVSADWLALSLLRTAGYTAMPPTAGDAFFSAPLQQSAIGDYLCVTQGAYRNDTVSQQPTWTTTEAGFAMIAGVGIYKPLTGGNTSQNLWFGCRVTHATGTGSVEIAHTMAAGDQWRIKIQANVNNTSLVVYLNWVSPGGSSTTVRSATIDTDDPFFGVQVTSSRWEVWTGDGLGKATRRAAQDIGAVSGATNRGARPNRVTIIASGTGVGIAGAQSGTNTAGAAAYCSWRSNVDIRLIGTGRINTSVNATPAVHGRVIDLLDDIAAACCRLHGLDRDGRYRWWDAAALRRQGVLESTQTVTTSQTGLAAWELDLSRQASSVEITRDVAAVTTANTQSCVVASGPSGNMDVGDDEWMAEPSGNTSWVDEVPTSGGDPSVRIKLPTGSTWKGSATVARVGASKFRIKITTTTKGEIDFSQLWAWGVGSWSTETETVQVRTTDGPTIGHDAGPWVADLGLPALRDHLSACAMGPSFTVPDMDVPDNVRDGDVLILDQMSPGGSGIRALCLVTEVTHAQTVDERSNREITRTAHLVALQTV